MAALLQARSYGQIAMSWPVYLEYLKVLHRPKFAKVIAASHALDMLDLLTVAANWYTPTETVSDCRDVKDNIFLELALASGADCIISGDTDLLALHPWRGFDVINASDFVSSERAETKMNARLDAEILKRYGVIQDEKTRLAMRNRLKAEYLTRGESVRRGKPD